MKGVDIMKKPIKSDKAPKAIGPYSQAIQAGDYLFTSGQVAIDPATGKLVEGDPGTGPSGYEKFERGVRVCGGRFFNGGKGHGVFGRYQRFCRV